MAKAKAKTKSSKSSSDSNAAEGIATSKENAKLEHSDGGVTTRDDRGDLGVPMKQGSPDEPQGPEDALGPGDKRGDYRDRIGPADYQPHEMAAVEDAGEDEPNVAPVAQRPRAEEIGEVEGKKGGVETA